LSTVNIPEKSEFRLGEVCEVADTQPYVLQFWETEFPQLEPKLNRKGTRVYSRADLETVLAIKRLLQDENHSIADARKILSKGGKRSAKRKSAARKSPPPPAREGTDAADVPVIHRTPTIERERYDTAVREIQRLKAGLKAKEEVEADLEALADAHRAVDRLQAELEDSLRRIETLESDLASRRERAERLAERLESLADRLLAAVDPSA